VVVVGGGDTSIDVATVARRLGHMDQVHESDRPENAIAGHAAHDAAVISRRQGAEVTLTSVFEIDKMQASRHEVEHALAEGIAIRGSMVPLAVLRDASGRATALRVARCEAKMVSGRLEIKPIEGTEEDIPADLIVSAIGQAVDFTGMESLNNGKGALAADRNYQVQAGGKAEAGMFCGGDVIRPHLLTTAIGHGAIAAEGIDRFLQGEPQDKRPKIDVHSFDLMRKLVEKGLPVTQIEEPVHGTDSSTGAVHNFDNRSDRYVIPSDELFLGHFNYTPRVKRKIVEKGLPVTQIEEPTWGTDRSTGAIHNYDNRSDRYVIPHDELFLGHFNYTPRHRRKVVSLTAEEALSNFEERLIPLLEAQAQAEAKRCMSCGQCFECDNCVVYCPQTAVFKVPKSKSTTGRYVDTDYTKCIGCHICKDVCPTGYIQMGLGE
jgi:Pyruvate/2-oxoacid:ferredoxin oxidoreductase delta subunit